MTLNPEIAASLRSIHEQLGDDFDASIGTSAPPVEDAPKGKKKRKNDRPKKEKKAAAAVAPAPRNKDGDHSPAVKVLAGAALVAVIGAAGFAALPHLAALMEDDAPPVLAALAPVGDPTQRFVIDGDTMYLEGSVPDQAISDSIESAAGAAIGQERVINNFEISDDAVFDPDQAVQLTVAETVQFRSGRADLSEQYEPLISLAVDLLTAEEQATLTVVGHTDDIGDEDANLRLSLSRATAVASLIEEHGIDPSRLTVDGRGESEPLTTNETAEGRAMNRRVEFSIVGVFG